MLRASSSVALLFALTLAGCSSGSDPVVKGPAQDISEVGEDCAGCLVDLAECSSTANTEQQFVECRDLFQSCQNDRDLQFGSCGSPSKQLACGLCQDRLSRCEEDGGDDAESDCGAEFDTCRQLLIRSSAFVCSADEDEPEAEATCHDCQRELALCAAGGDDAGVCQNGFAACRDIAGLGDECANPTDAEACELCDAQTATCNAQSDEATCATARASCVSQLASNPDACPAPDTSGEGGGTGEGGGGEGGSTGEGGGEPETTTTTGGGTCDHDACAEGEAPEATCNACTTEVCELDAFCCDGSWDATCVGVAANVGSCGCAADTCAHDACETGVALEQSCNECATTVCAEDDYCCTSEWDTMCTELAAQYCGCSV